MAKTTRIAVLLDDQDLEKLARILRPGEPMSSAFRRLLDEEHRRWEHASAHEPR
jgi:hypothetical protein